MQIPKALADAALRALGQLAIESVPVVVDTIAALAGPKVPPSALPLIKRLVVQIAESDNPEEYAKRALISTASAKASDALIDHLLK